MRVPQRRERWQRRRKRSRKTIRRSERPLLVVYRSTRHVYAQLVDAGSGRTITGVSTRSPGLADGLASTKNAEAARRVGEAIARKALEREIREVTFNRNGFVYTGRVKALADAAREAGLSF